MGKTAIIYASWHHGNTRKLVKTIAENYEITLIDASEQPFADLSDYDLIGFASGIDFGKFYNCVEQFLVDNLPERKYVFFLYTCAKTSDRFTTKMRLEAQKKNAWILGEYGCKGYNTYGPWRLIGGMNKKHPDDTDLTGALAFYESLTDHFE